MKRELAPVTVVVLLLLGAALIAISVYGTISILSKQQPTPPAPTSNTSYVYPGIGRDFTPSEQAANKQATKGE